MNNTDRSEQQVRQGNELNGKPLEVILGQLGSPASREDVEKFRCLLEDVRRDERSRAVGAPADETAFAESVARRIYNEIDGVPDVPEIVPIVEQELAKFATTSKVRLFLSHASACSRRKFVRKL